MATTKYIEFEGFPNHQIFNSQCHRNKVLDFWLVRSICFFVRVQLHKKKQMFFSNNIDEYSQLCSQKIPAFLKLAENVYPPKKIHHCRWGTPRFQRIGDHQLEELVVRLTFLEGSRQSSLYLNQWNMVSQL